MKGRRGGFTVTEMLTVVGILAVTMAVAVPAVVALRTGLKMRELDDTAREIFLAAQNSLTARRAADVSLELGTADEKADGCYWLSSGDADMKTLLPAGTVESLAAGNHSMIWYNADTATVMEVYYAENDLPEEEIKSTLYSDHYSGSGKEVRREARIGYYNGSGLDRGNVEPLVPPLLRIENTDELTAVVIVPRDKAAEYIKANVALTVTVEELGQDGNTVPGRQYIFPHEKTNYSAHGDELKLTLDSLTGEHFKDICGEHITPGADVRVTAKLEQQAGGPKIYLPASAHADANSLFSGRGAADGGDAVYIAYPRHLQNLEPAVSGLPQSGNRYAEQTAEIVWPAETGFRPICSRSLRGYNGNGNEIKSLRIDCGSAVKISFPNSGAGGSSGAGLFAFVEKTSLSNIRLVDPVLTGTDPAGAEYVGALAGILRESSVFNCQVYATGYAAGIDCAGHAGGLIGLALDDYAVTGSSASLPRIRSALDRAYIGGLIGCVKINSGYTTGLVKKCYANTGWMGENKKWAPDSGMRGINAAIGGLVGGTWNASGINEATDCYALGWFSGGSGGGLLGKPLGTYRISASYNILQSGSGNHYYVNQHPIDSLSDLKRFAWSGTIAKGGTTAYHPGVCGGDYPYPMLSLRHYGDWPVQTVDDVKLFDGTAAGSTELHYIMVPASKGTVAFCAEARSGESPAMEAVTVGGNGGGITEAAAEYGSAAGRTEITLTFPKDSARVTYVDLKADEFTLRAVVVLYDATVTLTGKNTNSGITATSKAFSNGNESETGTLPLNPNAKTGTLTAEMAVGPTREQIETAVTNWQAGTGGQFKVSAAAADFTDWEGIRSGDPMVTANGDPDAGTNILELVGGSNPTAGADGALTVTGAASGTAIVSARWAMDKTLKADCEVKMEGARALIEKASAMANGKPLGEKSGYPYRLDLIAEPGEQIDLTFTPKLFGGYTGEDGTYTWAVIRTEEDGSRTILTQGGPADKITSKPNDGNGGAWTYPLTDNRSRANYTVTLTYTNDSGEKSVDFMTFSAYRAASKDVSDYQGIKLYNRGAGQEISGTEAGQVEQLHSPDYPDVDTLLLEGCVDGAENTRVRWLAETSPGRWEPVTGIVGSQTVLDIDGKARAAVKWVSEENLLGADGKTPTGGAILVTGLDVNEYGEIFEINLKAEAMETAGTGDVPSFRTVTIKVMPKLEITPKAKAVVSVDSKDFTFEANRTDTTSWQFEWSWTGKGPGTISGNCYTISPIRQYLTGGYDKNATNTITCKYGPFTATATYTWQGLLGNLTAPINADYFVDKGGSFAGAAGNKEYFIVEKGETRELELVWDSQLIQEFKKGPESTSYIGLKETYCEDPYFDFWQPWNNRTNGCRKYDVTGTEFTGDDVETLEWVIGRNDWIFPKYFAVVGMEINGNKNFVLLKDQTVQLSATTSFARELWEDGAEPTLTWESDHPELVSVDENGRIRALKNGAATYSATITAAYTVECRNGKTYTFKDYVTVEVQPEGTMHVTLEPCTADDAATLNQTFDGADLTASSVLVPVDGEGRWTLVRSEGFGLNTMYLKAAATLDGAALPDLNDYICNVSGDASYLSIESRERGGVLYVRLRAKEANVEVTDVDLIAEIGTASAEGTVSVYDAPSVKLTLPDGTDVTNGSRPVYLNETDLSAGLTAALEPTLYSYEDRDRKTPLNSVEWALEASAGYEPGRYLDLVPTDGNENEITVTLKQEDRRMPDFRVVLHARGREGGGGADAGYALVFLPEEESEEP